MTDADHTTDEPLYAPSDVIEVLDRLGQIVEGSRQVPLSASVLVNRAEILELIATARESLPADVVRADRIVGDASAVLDRADAEASQTMSEASSYASSTREEADVYARNTREEADRHAEQSREQAESQARQIIEKAKAAGRDILDKARAAEKTLLAEAHARAEEAVSKETIYREAVQRGEEHLAKTREKARSLAEEADTYVSNQLRHLEEEALAIAKQARGGREQVGRR
ncbi:MAG: hypothetical protein Q4B10_04735 [Actinomycetaceae bacterium]|nr:hypothetical protein [Actinomycetaceae bacterium]